MSASPTGPGRIIAVVGLAREARIAAGPGVHCLVGGGDGERLAADLEHAASEGARAILSFGIAGGLDPILLPGAYVIGTAVTAVTTSAPSPPTVTAVSAQSARTAATAASRLDVM